MRKDTKEIWTIGTIIVITLILVTLFAYKIIIDLKAQGVYYHEMSHEKNYEYIDGCKNITIEISKDGLSGETWVTNCNLSKEAMLANAITEAVGYNLNETTGILDYILAVQIIFGTLGVLIISFMLIKINRTLENGIYGIRSRNLD